MNKNAYYIVNFTRIEKDLIIVYQGLEQAKKRLELEKINNPDQDIRLLVEYKKGV